MHSSIIIVELYIILSMGRRNTCTDEIGYFSAIVIRRNDHVKTLIGCKYLNTIDRIMEICFKYTLLIFSF